METTIVALDSTQYNQLLSNIDTINEQLVLIQTSNQEQALFFTTVLLIMLFALIVGVVKSFVR